MKLEIDGQIVEVDDSFANLDSAAQQKTVDEIAASLKAPTQERAAMTAAPSAAPNAAAYGMQAAATPAIGGINYTNVPAPNMTGPVQPGQTMKPGIVPYVAEDMAAVGKTVANNATLGHALDLIKKEGLTGAGAEFTKAVLHPFTQQTLTGAAKNIAGGIGQGLMAPENLMTLPYNMAAYEQEKIRANPTAPEYKTTPYAQAYRGEYPTQGAAAAANRREAIRGQQYGGLSADEQQMLKQDRELSYAMRLKAAKKVLGQQ